MGRCNLYAMVLVVLFMVVHSEWDWLQPVVRIALPHYTTGTADHYEQHHQNHGVEIAPPHGSYPLR